jgi:hypothetical protein
MLPSFGGEAGGRSQESKLCAVLIADPLLFPLPLFPFQQPMEIYVDDETKLTLHGLVQHYIKLTEAGAYTHPLCSPPFSTT